MRKRYAKAEDKSSAEFVVVTVIPADDLRPHVSGKLPGIETQSLAQRRDVAEVHLRNIDVVCNRGRTAPEQSVGRCNLGNAGACDHIEAEPELVGLFNGALDHQLRHVKLRIVVVEIEDAELVQARVRLVGIVLGGYQILRTR